MLKATKTRLCLSNSYLSQSPVAFICFDQMYVYKQKNQSLKLENGTQCHLNFQISTQIFKGKVQKFEVKLEAKYSHEESW